MNQKERNEGIRWSLWLGLILFAAVAAMLLTFLKPGKQQVPTPNSTSTEVTGAASEPEPPKKVTPEVAPHPRGEIVSPVEELFGIQISSVELAMGGAALDVRFRVVDAERAAALSSGRILIHVVDEDSGTKLSLPSYPDSKKFSAHDRAMMARQRGAFPPSPNALSAGNTNSVLLPNALQRVKSGSRVSVFVGDAQVNHVVVP